MSSSARIAVAVATTVTQTFMADIQSIDDRLEVRYEPDLLSPAPWPAAGRASGFARTEVHRRRWDQLIGGAEVVFGPDSVDDLAEVLRVGRRLRWLQSTIPSVAERLRTAKPATPLAEDVTITGTGSILATALAEFGLFGVLAFADGAPGGTFGASPTRPVRQLAGQTMLVVGLGPVGRAVARLAAAFGMHVNAINRTGDGAAAGVESIRPPWFIGDLLPVSHAVVLALPETERTVGLIGARAIDRMRSDAVVVALGAGRVIDESALVAGLQAGQPAAAVFDGYAGRALSADSPLRRLPSTLVAQAPARPTHTDDRITAVFLENLRRYLRGGELLNPVPIANRGVRG
ncbi:MAG: NAD(P)-dependent oxidoreductase [Microbacteriaceae bacterium]